jgi:Spy/CpxP family protein refolding chaperone
MTKPARPISLPLPLPLSLSIAIALAATAALAQAPEEDPFQGALFPPELVMLHADAIGLDEAQRDALKEAVKEVQPLFLDRQFELQAELGRLRKQVAAAQVDEAAALASLDRILALEREIKRAQVGLLVRLKNLLRPEQQRRLAALRDEG